jgi:hypothetical protein
MPRGVAGAAEPKTPRPYADPLDDISCFGHILPVGATGFLPEGSCVNLVIFLVMQVRLGGLKRHFHDV